MVRQMVRSLLVVAAALALASGPAPGAAERIALVIGNQNYTDRPLRNSVQDAKDMASVLARCGFRGPTGKLFPLIDLDERGLKKAISEFGKAHGSQSVGLFYYSGHGCQHNGVSYLIPIGARVHSAGDIEFECVAATRVLAKMHEARSRTNIVIISSDRFEFTVPVGSFR